MSLSRRRRCPDDVYVSPFGTRDPLANTSIAEVQWVLRPPPHVVQSRQEALRVIEEARAIAHEQRVQEERQEAASFELVQIQEDLHKHEEKLPALQETLIAALERFKASGDMKKNHDGENLEVYRAFVEHMENANTMTYSQARYVDICCWFTVGLPKEIQDAVRKLAEHWHKEARMQLARDHAVGRKYGDPSWDQCDNETHQVDDHGYAAVRKSAFGFEKSYHTNGYSDCPVTWVHEPDMIKHIRAGLETRKVRLVHATNRHRWPCNEQANSFHEPASEEWKRSVDGHVVAWIDRAEAALLKTEWKKEEMKMEKVVLLLDLRLLRSHLVERRSKVERCHKLLKETWTARNDVYQAHRTEAALGETSKEYIAKMTTLTVRIDELHTSLEQALLERFVAVAAPATGVVQSRGVDTAACATPEDIIDLDPLQQQAVLCAQQEAKTKSEGHARQNSAVRS